MDTKIGDTMILSDEYLQNERFMFLTDSQELEAILDHMDKDIKELWNNDLTAALVEVGEGDYNEVWFSDASSPWNTCNYYERVI